MKKAEKKLASAQRSASNAREYADTLAMATTAAAAAAPVLAGTVLPMLPGPTAAELTELAAKRKSPLASKRVYVPAALAGGLALFGGRSLGMRVAATFLAATAGVAYQATKLTMAGDASAVQALVVEVKK